MSKKERETKIPLDDELRSDLWWRSWNSRTISGSQASSSSSATWQERHDRHGWREWQEWVQLPWAVSHFARFSHNRRCVFIHFACRHPRMSCTRRGVKTEHLVARTFFTVLLVLGAGLMSVASWSHPNLSQSGSYVSMELSKSIARSSA